MGKIKQGILGGFRGTVGTVVGSSWNGIAYMKGKPQSVRNPRTDAQVQQRGFFKELLAIASQLSAEQQAFLFPSSPKGMTRRNALVQQLAAAATIDNGEKHVDLASLTSLGNAPTADIPDVEVTASRSNITIAWDGENDWRTAHANEYPTIFLANVTQKKVFLVHSTVTIGASGSQSFGVDFGAYGIGSDTFIGFMLSTGATTAPHGFGTIGVNERPARPPKKNS